MTSGRTAPRAIYCEPGFIQTGIHAIVSFVVICSLVLGIKLRIGHCCDFLCTRNVSNFFNLVNLADGVSTL